MSALDVGLVQYERSNIGWAEFVTFCASLAFRCVFFLMTSPGVIVEYIYLPVPELSAGAG